MIAEKLKSSIAEAEAVGTQRVRRMAAQMGWPSNLASTLYAKVDHESGDMVAKSDADIFDYEYGTERQPPKPVIRIFNDRYRLLHSEILAKRLGL